MTCVRLGGGWRFPGPLWHGSGLVLALSKTHLGGGGWGRQLGKANCSWFILFLFHIDTMICMMMLIRASCLRHTSYEVVVELLGPGHLGSCH